MKQVLEKQLATLEKIDKNIEQDRLLQISQAVVQAKTDKDINEDNEVLAKKLDGIQKTLERGLASKDPSALNSNVIKLFKEVQKQSERTLIKDRKTTERSEKYSDSMSAERSEKITEKSMGLDQFKTFGEKVSDFKTDISKSVKEFFTLKGFLNKTGIVSPESKGMVATALAKREAKRQYIKDRMAVDPNLVNLKQYSGDEKKLKADLAIQFDKQQKIKREQRESVQKSQGYEAEIQGLRDRGYGEEQIKRSKAFKNLQAETEKRRGISERLAEVDPRYRESAMKTEKEKEEANPRKTGDTTKEEKSNVIPFSDENQLEATRLAERQVGLLEKIEENTRGLANIKAAPAAAAESGGGGSLLDMLPGRGFLRGAKTLGGKLLSGGKALAGGALRFAGSPLGMKLGAGLAVAGGAYTAYKGYTGAEEEKQQKLVEIDEAVKSGQITEQQANEQKAALDESTVEKKGGAIGEGTGMAAGGIAGAKLGAAAGAAIGSFVPVVGTAIGAGAGALIGGAAGAFGGAKAGKVIGEYGGKAVNLGKKAITNIGDRISNVFNNVKDSYNRGTDGTLAAQNVDEEVARRMKAEGVEFGSDRANKIRDEVRKEILAKDPSAFKFADQKVSSVADSKTTDSSLNGMTTSTSELNQGITAKKSILGSEFLGSLFTKKGLQTGSFSGTSESSKRIDSATDSLMSSADNVTTKSDQIYGNRVSGGIFGKDTYNINQGDKTTAVSKSQYNEIQNLIAEGKVDEASKKIQVIRENSDKLTGMTPSMSPEEMLTPVSEGAAKGTTFSDIGKKISGAFNGSKILSAAGPVGLAVNAARNLISSDDKQPSVLSGLADKAKNLFGFGKSEEQGKALPASSFSGEDLKPRMIAGKEWTPGTAFTKDQMKELEGRKDLTHAVAMQYEYQKSGKTAPISESISQANLSSVKPSEGAAVPPPAKQASVIEKEAPRSTVYDGSRKNADMAAAAQQQPSVPVIVNAPTTNVAKTTQNTTLPTPIRNDDGAVRDYFSKRYSF